MLAVISGQGICAMGLQRYLRIVWLGCILSPATGWDDDYEIIQAGCKDLPNSKVKIEKCLSLVHGSKISKTYFPQVYDEVAFAFSKIDDYPQAIIYTRTEIEIATENMKAEIASGK